MRKRKNKETFLPSEQTKWQNAATNKLMKNASGKEAEQYANHMTKAAIDRRQRKNEKEGKKGILNG